MKIKKIIGSLLILVLLSTYLPIVANISFATTAMDYDFTDELDTDRTGIGFIWTASTKTLEITGIKNSSAELILPAGAKIEISENSSNTIKYIYSEGDISISGNEEGSLSIVGGYVYYTSSTIKYSSSIYVSSLNIESGNISSGKITCSEDFIMSNGNVSARSSEINVIEANIIEINGGKLEVYGFQETRPAFSATQIIINDGEVKGTTREGRVYDGTVIINGGSIEGYSNTVGWNVFSKVPNINPEYKWYILYDKNNSNLDEAKEADITDIYNIYNSTALKISKDEDYDPIETINKTTSNALDYDFTDELETDRVGIGFIWTASTKTLEIAGIKNSSAELILPAGTRIEITGNCRNNIKYIYSEGDITISGNEEAELSTSGGYVYYTSSTIKYSSSIYVSSLNIESGNISSGKITCSEDFIMSNGNVSARSSEINVIEANIIEINGGKLEVYGFQETRPAFSATQIIINDGEVKGTTREGRVYDGTVIINGGSIEGYSNTVGWNVFSKVPNINPEYKWYILYDKNNSNLDEAKEADITDIYNIYNSTALKICKLVPTTNISVVAENDTILVGNSTKYTANVQPSNSTERIVWSTENPDIAEVSIEGEVTAKSIGKTKIIATSGEFSDYKEINVVCNISFNDMIPNENNIINIYTSTDGKISEIPIPTRSGCEFLGWYTGKIGGEKITTETVFENSTTVYARWEAKQTFNINFDANGGTGLTSSIDTDAKIEELPTATRDGYEFLGWYTEKTGGEQITTDTVFDKNTTVYAHWKKNIEPIIMGDINGDTKINVKDWNILYNYINETSDLNEIARTRADINRDGKVNVKDWNRLYEHINEENPIN